MSDDERKRPDDPGAEAPPSPEEERQAAALAAALDAGSGGAPPSGADEALDDLLAIAGMIRASERPAPLGRDRRDALVAEALAAAGARPASRPASRWRRVAPLLAMAASVIAIFGAVLAGLPLVDRQGGLPAVRPAASSERLQSRSSDALLGRPIVDRAGAARRLDRVLADRLAGYRQIRLAGR